MTTKDTEKHPRLLAVLPDPKPGWEELKVLTREQLLSMAAHALAAAKWLEAQR
jgi:hypothetical protein